MSDVVTGKVDVRHLAPERIDEEVDGLGMLDADDGDDALDEEIGDEGAEEGEWGARTVARGRGGFSSDHPCNGYP